MKYKSLLYRTILEVYENAPKKFNGITLVKKVRRNVMKPDMFADTVMRSMRSLRQDNIINYECIDRTKSLYQKIDTV